MVAATLVTANISPKPPAWFVTLKTFEHCCKCWICMYRSDLYWIVSFKYITYMDYLINIYKRHVVKIVCCNLHITHYVFKQKEHQGFQTLSLFCTVSFLSLLEHVTSYNLIYYIAYTLLLPFAWSLVKRWYSEQMCSWMYARVRDVYVLLKNTNI